jgi:tRNA-Thr(GGU) m(6)t(6)A37 methyltransferase TsaA
LKTGNRGAIRIIRAYTDQFNNSGKKMKIEFTPIGTIHSPFKEPGNMPIQPADGAGVKGTVEVFEDFHTGLEDLDGFSHIILLYHFHRSRSVSLRVVPFMDSETRGLFATRAPKRPNPIGLSIVRLDKIEDGVLHIQNIDIIDGTPLLDIKPYVPEFDAPMEVRTGWLEKAGETVSSRKSDDRFK